MASGKKDGVIAPIVLPDRAGYHAKFVLVTLVVYHGAYEMLRWLFEKNFTSYLGWTLCETDGNDEENKCGRSDLFAFQCLSGSIFVLCGGLGIYSWYSLSDTLSPESRLFGYNYYAEILTLLNFCYQLWDIAVSLTIPEHCTAIMMTHHCVAAIVSWSALYNHMMGYYAVFFLGLSEVSSIFLVTTDAARFFENGISLDRVVEPISGPMFALTFVYFRVIRWWPTSKQLFDDVNSVKESAEWLRPGRTWILYMWLVFNLPMGLLQLYWTILIYEEAKGVIGIHSENIS